MPQVSYNPQSADRPYLPKKGLYGPNQENPAKCTIIAVRQAEPGSMDAPFADKECTKDSYTVWDVRVEYKDITVIARSRAQANTLESQGSKNLAWLANLGISPVGTDPDTGFPIMDTDKAVGHECVVKVADPRQDKEDKEVWYNGAVLEIYAVPGR